MANGTYADQSYVNDCAFGARVAHLEDVAALRAIFPSDVKIGSFEGAEGYLNRDGGWAAAAQGVEIILNKVRNEGVRVLAGKAVVELVKNAEGQTVGVKCQDGTIFDADLIVVASGSWTPATFKTLDLRGKCLATG